MESPVNPDIHLDDDLLGRSYFAAVEYFTERFPDNAKLHLIGADQDQIVRPLEVLLPETLPIVLLSCHMMMQVFSHGYD